MLTDLEILLLFGSEWSFQQNAYTNFHHTLNAEKLEVLISLKYINVTL